VSGLVNDIASASTEQASGIAQVSEGLAHIDQVTQRNTAVAEETASAATILSGEAVDLREVIAQFRLPMTTNLLPVNVEREEWE
jgi:methyl-accepting chemotaxis protein